MKSLLRTYEWLAVVGVVFIAGITATAFIFGSFDAKGSSEKVAAQAASDLKVVKDDLSARMDRSEELQIAILTGLDIPVPKKRPAR